MSEKQKRNELCTCGSQKKYKKCCGLQKAVQKQKSFTRFPLAGGVMPSMKGLTQKVFKVLGNETATKQLKDLQALKKESAE